MVAQEDGCVQYQTERPANADEKRAARRARIPKMPWFGVVASYVEERERYAADRQAAAETAPERRRGWVARSDRLQAMIAILAAWQDWQGSDERGTRRSVPAGQEYVADILTVLGFADGVKAESLDSNVGEWFTYLRRSKRVRVVCPPKRVTGNKEDGDATEYLTYFDGREFNADEPHARIPSAHEQRVLS